MAERAIRMLVAWSQKSYLLLTGSDDLIDITFTRSSAFTLLPLHSRRSKLVLPDPLTMHRTPCIQREENVG